MGTKPCSVTSNKEYSSEKLFKRISGREPAWSSL